MQNINYIVTFTGDYPCGGNHPLIVKATALDVESAISAARNAIEDDRIEATNLILISVVPESCPAATEDLNSDGALKPCPFCGNPHVSLVETIPYFGGENMHFVNCGCCNASQLPDTKEGAIYHWNQREEVLNEEGI
ncbi:Lar family restriction alleviation protein [Yersinia enterocolitica]|uniref:Restriction alleviation protein, Lar family n=1 Tax=Yersinia enterocolitica TaxID=630 RepID=A0ABP1YAM8_YEREN|nr:Lar family restriction alleviation protein [Yersinia enterocolitica]CNE38146.1 restriction alleviation protein%2C Lar family [Yersinia enterocolitica]CNF68499.1 restriction alleviation protein%2C Lar family [Yersinia enterocolitica]CQD63466.1 restriction alleviation protein%2C Lar family [Yersinia enterocolitica]CRX91228.1 restriction alleviation protein%2C Lar family [Yersinia enterocolitica]